MSQGPTSQRLRPFKPARFGRYALLMPISAGGMGEVFLARLSGAHGFDKLCVIKKMLPQLAADKAFVARFIDEGRILVKLSHGSIAQVLDMGVHEGAPYMAIEFIDGKDLRRVLSRMRDRRLPVPLSFVLYVMTRVLDALAYAHRKRGDDDRELNLVHRDISPQNILVSYEGEVKVIDFGLAKSSLSESHTNPSIVLGKFMYMAPEQARHLGVDRRTDLYAVGLCLWELVTGKNPFEDVPQTELMARVGHPSIPPLNQVEPLCPQALAEVVAKALAVDPAQRFQTAEEFRNRLQLILQDIDPAAGPETATRFMREAFGVEYHAERRMLSAVKEQAQQLDAAEPEPPAEETIPAPSAPRPTPLAMPALQLEPAAPPSSSRLSALEPVALSFQPTPRAEVPGRRDVPAEVAERETMPAIQVNPAPSPPVSSPGGHIRARTLVKSFEQDETEAAAPAIASPAEPEPLPSIVVEGLPEEPPGAEPESATSKGPRDAARALAEEPTAPRGRPVTKKGVKKVKRDKPGPRPSAPTPAVPPEPPKAVAPPVAPARTDTLEVRSVGAQPAEAAVKKKGASWLWFVVPILAVLALAGFIVADLLASPAAEPVDTPTADVAEEAPPPLRLPPVQPLPLDDEPEEVPPPAQLPPKVAEPRKKGGAAPRVKEGGGGQGSPGEKAFKALKADYERLPDEGVQRRFKLQLNALAGQVATKGDDPDFLLKVEALHEKVRAALADGP